jgi:hypothetical protein
MSHFKSVETKALFTTYNLLISISFDASVDDLDCMIGTEKAELMDNHFFDNRYYYKFKFIGLEYNQVYTYICFSNYDKM